MPLIEVSLVVGGVDKLMGFRVGFHRIMYDPLKKKMYVFLLLYIVVPYVNNLIRIYALYV